ncbi:MAG: AAA family ATPase [Actinomycetota bacterium]
MAGKEKGSAKKKKRSSGKPKSRLGLVIGIALLLLIGGYFGALEYSRPHVTGDTLAFYKFVDLVEQGRIKTGTILDEDAYVIGKYVKGDGSEGSNSEPSTFDADGMGHGDGLTPGPAKQGADPAGQLREFNAPLIRNPPQGSTVIKLFIENRIPIFVDQQTGKRVANLAIYTIPALILILLFVYLIVSYVKGTGLFGVKSGARKIEAEDSKVTFADVAGQERAIAELNDIKEFLADPARFVAIGATIPKGILLFGPPGCGKTLLSRALAGESNAAFYTISGSDFVELYVGVGAARVRDLFQEARANSPAIVFIDELDSVGRRRGGNTAGGGGTQGEQEQALNQILAEMDGFSPLEGIIVVGATNRPDVLDPALLRPGRFDRTVGLERADEAGRLAILQVHAANKQLEDGVDMASIARRAIGLSGADLASVLNEGALLAARSQKSKISQSDLEDALARIKEAPERQRRLSMRDRSFGRSTSDQRVTFADVAGVDEALIELAEVKEYLAEPERFIEMGARPPRGFLLVGPPGCGKTLLARAVAGEANAVFFSVAATEFVEVFVGEGAGRVRDLFAEARTMAPAIVFIDEIDAIGAHRGASAGSGNRESDQTLNQILVELDGFQAGSGVIVMAASNRPDILDPALIRPGRFDRTVTIGLPDRAGRRAILDVHARGKKLAPEVDLDVVAGLTQGLSGAELANVMNEATLLAARRKVPAATLPLIEEAVERVHLGVSRAHILSEEERKVVAYHEAGHALVGRALHGAPSPRKLSIVPRGATLGAAWHEDSVEEVVHSRTVLIERMAGMLGGRAAEEVVFGEPSSGASDDLAKVGNLARWMVCELAMGTTLGQMTYGDDTGRAQGGAHNGYSDEAARSIDTEVRRLIDLAFEKAKSILSDSRKQLDSIAQALIERETLTSDELDELAGPPPKLGARAASNGGLGTAAKVAKAAVLKGLGGR